MNKRTIDGLGNNVNRPELGQVGEELLRVSVVDYGDSVSSMAGDLRPNTRTISNEIFSQSTNTGNSENHSNYMWMWGQFVDHDMSLTPPAGTETEDIAVPLGDPHFDPNSNGTAKIDFTRSTFDETTGTGVDNPRQQVNEITPFFDASSIYGSDAVRSAALRGEDGKLVTSAGDLLPFNTSGLPNDPSPSPTLFLAGDVRANENIGLTSLHTIFMREHNRLVDELAANDATLSGDELYDQARKLVEAKLQIITYDEFLPKLLGEGAIEDWSGYQSDIDPQIANEFSTAAFRLGHTMLSSQVMRSNEDGSESAFGHLLLRDAFFRPDRLVTEGGIDDVLRGAGMGQAETLDASIIDDVRNFLFGQPGAGGFDLAALNIQRGRDHGLDDYNSVREAYGLDPVTTFADITSDTDLQAKLQSVYGSVDDIDLYVGGLSEDPVEGSLMGELFHTILVDQFTRTRDGDRFWHENQLTVEELGMVENTTLAQIIEDNTGVDHMQDDVFATFSRVAGSAAAEEILANEDYALVMADDGNDIVKGGEGTQQMHGEEGRDALYGNGGDDLLYGDDGNDFLSAGEGADMLNGGEGGDRMHGGTGEDTFVFSQGRDSVLDFSLSDDTLDFSSDAKILSMDDLTVKSTVMGTRLTDADDDSVFLWGVHNVENLQGKFVSGEAEDDGIIRGEAGHTLWGTTGDDVFAETEGKQSILGREGDDTLIVRGNYADHTIQKINDFGMFRITDAEGYDNFWDIETLRFDDGTLDMATMDFDVG